jgi:hypothetical protein
MLIQVDEEETHWVSGGWAWAEHKKEEANKVDAHVRFVYIDGWCFGAIAAATKAQTRIVGSDSLQPL